MGWGGVGWGSVPYSSLSSSSLVSTTSVPAVVRVKVGYVCMPCYLGLCCAWDGRLYRELELIRRQLGPAIERERA